MACRSASILSSNTLIKERTLYGIELLAVPAVAPAFEGRHLMRELVDLQLLVLEFFFAAGKPCIALTELGIALGAMSVVARSRSSCASI
jgi:hypothetical protein